MALIGPNGDAERGYVYSEAPFLVYWELTRACDLACRHCRAEAVPRRDPGELTFSEAKDVLDMMRDFGARVPHLVLTGGDPLKRPDLFDILDYGDTLGLGMSVAPSGTYALAREVFKFFWATGVESVALSLDGSTRERHDGFRLVPGCFDRTMTAARLAKEEGLDLQVNTLVTAETESDLPALYRLVGELGVRRWSLFYLIRVGRGVGLNEITPERCERLHHWLCDVAGEAPFTVATTEAPHFRRVAFTRMRARGIPFARIRETPMGRGFGIRDGNGIMFVSHDGEVYPSGFLPLAGGSVRATHMMRIYRESEVFRTIRQTSGFKGKCGRCEFRAICGGSRARAYAAYGDFLAEDPICNYRPGLVEAEFE